MSKQSSSSMEERKEETEMQLLAAEERQAGLEGEAEEEGGEEPMEMRQIHIGQDLKEYADQLQRQHPGKNVEKLLPKYCDNEVTTSKYTIFPFSRDFIIWKNLFEQFKRAANCYFLFIAVLQAIPGVSPTGRYTTIMPLSLVLFLSLLKDAYEDYKRHKQDKEVNNSHTHVWRGSKWIKVCWKDARVGEIMKIPRGKPFPADVVLLYSTEPEGICYIETSSLDGETNLKIRKAVSQTNKIFDPQDPGKLSAVFSFEAPNNRLYNFDGNMVMGGQMIPLTNEAVLLRGAALRNTGAAYGLIIYTGSETKLMKNASDKHHKMSNMDLITNKQVLFVFVLQLVLALIGAIGLGIFTTFMGEHWYLAQETANPVTTALIGYLTFLILFNNLIPISLYVSMEMVKLVQAGLIGTDLNMYYEPVDTPAMARTSALNEELGQVTYIFSDKTGTLTCNMMDFMKFSCIGSNGEAVQYGTGTTEIARAAALRNHEILEDDRPAGYVAKDGFCFYDHKVSDGAWLNASNKAQIEEFVMHLALCHTVVIEADDDDPTKTQYQAASPDEACLVKGARELGAEFVERTESSITICVNGVRSTWDVLNIIEFDSTRKRMSCVVRSPEGKLTLLCKGADSVIYDRLKRTSEQEQLLEDTLTMLTKFAADGLRTLVIAKSELEEEQYQAWAARYDAALCALENRAEKVALVGEEIEVDLTLVGTTAIEDKLQGGVPQTIELLMAGGIKVWVLTGDKQETAINIGYACALLNNEMTQFYFDEGCSKRNLRERLAEFNEEAKTNTDQMNPCEMSLVIQGGLLENVLEDEENAQSFLKLATQCKAVICCRVSPLQKSQVVTLVKDNITSITLAIGDGANDVSMIQSANVGIGISGLEGLQAARASDYSIAQFRFLQQLLLVHGRWNYRRISRLILYSFYKNISLYLTQFWFCLLNAFSGQSLYDNWALAMYNVWFTAFPVMVVAVFDRDVEAKRTLGTDQFPDLYRDGISGRLFNTQAFWKYVFNAIYHSCLAFFLPVACVYYTIDAEDGRPLDLSSVGILVYTTILVIVTAKVGLETLSWTFVNVACIAGSLLMWFFFIFFYGSMYQWMKTFSDMARWYGIAGPLIATPVFWLVAVATIMIACSRDFIWKYYRRNFNPELSHVVQVLETELSDFKRIDVTITHPYLLSTLESTQPKEGTHLFRAHEMSHQTGYAFSQEEGHHQAEVTRVKGAKWAKLRGAVAVSGALGARRTAKSASPTTIPPSQDPTI